MFQVGLIATEHNVRVFAVGVTLQLFDPVLDLEKGSLVSQVEDQEKSHGVTVKSGGETAKTFLASRVPELQVQAMVPTTRCVNLKAGMCK